MGFNFNLPTISTTTFIIIVVCLIQLQCYELNLSKHCKKPGEKIPTSVPSRFKKCVFKNNKFYEEEFSCRRAHYFNQRNQKCSRIPGGGYAIKYHDNQTCPENYTGLLHVNNYPNYYHVCGENREFYAKCFSNYIFNDFDLKCIKKKFPVSIRIWDKSGENCNVSVPKCTAPGTFPIEGSDILYYRCFPGSYPILYQEVHKCKRKLKFSSLKKRCVPRFKEELYEKCAKEGCFPLAGECKRFYYCKKDEFGNFNKTIYTCPKGKLFDRKQKCCVNKDIAYCPENDDTNMQDFIHAYDNSAQNENKLEKDESMTRVIEDSKEINSDELTAESEIEEDSEEKTSKTKNVLPPKNNESKLNGPVLGTKRINVLFANNQETKKEIMKQKKGSNKKGTSNRDFQLENEEPNREENLSNLSESNTEIYNNNYSDENNFNTERKTKTVYELNKEIQEISDESNERNKDDVSGPSTFTNNNNKALNEQETNNKSVYENTKPGILLLKSAFRPPINKPKNESDIEDKPITPTSNNTPSENNDQAAIRQKSVDELNKELQTNSNKSIEQNKENLSGSPDFTENTTKVSNKQETTSKPEELQSNNKNTGDIPTSETSFVTPVDKSENDANIQQKADNEPRRPILKGKALPTNDTSGINDQNDATVKKESKTVDEINKELQAIDDENIEQNKENSMSSPNFVKIDNTENKQESRSESEELQIDNKNTKTEDVPILKSESVAPIDKLKNGSDIQTEAEDVPKKPILKAKSPTTNNNISNGTNDQNVPAIKKESKTVDNLNKELQPNNNESIDQNKEGLNSSPNSTQSNDKTLNEHEIKSNSDELQTDNENKMTNDQNKTIDNVEPIKNNDDVLNKPVLQTKPATENTSTNNAADSKHTDNSTLKTEPGVPINETNIQSKAINNGTNTYNAEKTLNKPILMSTVPVNKTIGGESDKSIAKNESLTNDNENISLPEKGTKPNEDNDANKQVPNNTLLDNSKPAENLNSSKPAENISNKGAQQNNAATSNDKLLTENEPKTKNTGLISNNSSIESKNTSLNETNKNLNATNNKDLNTGTPKESITDVKDNANMEDNKGVTNVQQDNGAALDDKLSLDANQEKSINESKPEESITDVKDNANMEDNKEITGVQPDNGAASDDKLSLDANQEKSINENKPEKSVTNVKDNANMEDNKEVTDVQQNNGAALDDELLKQNDRKNEDTGLINSKPDPVMKNAPLNTTSKNLNATQEKGINESKPEENITDVKDNANMEDNKEVTDVQQDNRAALDDELSLDATQEKGIGENNPEESITNFKENANMEDKEEITGVQQNNEAAIDDTLLTENENKNEDSELMNGYPEENINNLKDINEKPESESVSLDETNNNNNDKDITADTPNENIPNISETKKEDNLEISGVQKNDKAAEIDKTLSGDVPKMSENENISKNPDSIIKNDSISNENKATKDLNLNENQGEETKLNDDSPIHNIQNNDSQKNEQQAVLENKEKTNIENENKPTILNESQIMNVKDVNEPEIPDNKSNPESALIDVNVENDKKTKPEADVDILKKTENGDLVAVKKESNKQLSL